MISNIGIKYLTNTFFWQSKNPATTNASFHLVRASASTFEKGRAKQFLWLCFLKYKDFCSAFSKSGKGRIKPQFELKSYFQTRQNQHLS